MPEQFSKTSTKCIEQLWLSNIIWILHHTVTRQVYDIDVAKIAFNNGGCIGHQSGVVTSFIMYLPTKDHGSNNTYYPL